MGLFAQEVKGLVEFYRRHGPLGKTATIGRQMLFASRSQMTPTLKDLPKAAEFLARLPKRDYPFAEKLFALLGATEVVSFDNSDYEGATAIHDMNAPIPGEYRERFDVVYNGGAIEHVFNFPQAIRNCMDLTKVGGVFISASPANNYLGHGFYQFSPELFFRLFSRENGFEMERSLAFENEWRGGWFEMTDPRKLQRRAELLATGERIQLWVEARKVKAQAGELPLLPQQSDYVAQWEAVPARPPGVDGRPQTLRDHLRELAEGHFPRLLDEFRRVRDRRKLRAVRKLGLLSDPGAYRRIT